MRLIDLICKYIRMLKREKSHALRSVISYESDLKLFARFIGESRAIYDISDHLIERYFRNLVEHRRMSSATISRKTCVVRGFFRYLENGDYILRSPMSRLPLKAKIHRKTPIHVTPDEISQLFRFIEEEHRKLQQNLTKRRDRGDKDRLVEYQLFCNIRNNVLFRVLLETGIRTAELTKIGNDRVHILRKSGSIYPDKSSNRHYVISNPDTLKLLKDYQRQVKQNNFQSPYFFFNRNREQLSTVMIQNIFRTYLKQTTIKRQLTPSSLRHTFAVNLIKQNTDMNTIRDILGYKTFEGLLLYQEHFNTYSQSKQGKK